MTRQVWQIQRFSSDETATVQSLQYSTGRQTQFDSYSPGSLTFTIRNNVGQAEAYDLNDRVTLTAVGTSGFYQYFYVQEVLYNDLPGDGAGSTATIVCTDLLGRLGRINVFQKVIAQAKTLNQIQTAFGSLLPASTSFNLYSGGSSTAAAEAAYTGTALNRLNLNMITEQGWLSVTDQGVYLYGRADVAEMGGTITFARAAAGTTTMGYSDIKRIALGSNYLNLCTATPTIAATQNAADSAGITTFGTYGAEFSTVDQSSAQALSFAQWQVFSRSDQNQLSFQISVSDTANNLTQLFDAIYTNFPVVTVSYKNPGDATIYTSQQVMQGFNMQVTSDATYMEIYTSPLTYTNFFTLNSAQFGVLNTSRLGW